MRLGRAPLGVCVKPLELLWYWTTIWALSRLADQENDSEFNFWAINMGTVQVLMKANVPVFMQGKVPVGTSTHWYLSLHNHRLITWTFRGRNAPRTARFTAAARRYRYRGQVADWLMLMQGVGGGLPHTSIWSVFSRTGRDYRKLKSSLQSKLFLCFLELRHFIRKFILT